MVPISLLFYQNSVSGRLLEYVCLRVRVCARARVCVCVCVSARDNTDSFRNFRVRASLYCA